MNERTRRLPRSTTGEQSIGLRSLPRDELTRESRKRLLRLKALITSSDACIVAMAAAFMRGGPANLETPDYLYCLNWEIDDMAVLDGRLRKEERASLTRYKKDDPSARETYIELSYVSPGTVGGNNRTSVPAVGDTRYVDYGNRYKGYRSNERDTGDLRHADEFIQDLEVTYGKNLKK